MNALLKRVLGRSAPSLGTDCAEIKAHVLKRIAETEVGHEPFRFLYIDELLPCEFYDALFAEMQAFKSPDRMIARNQDSAGFQNRRYPLAAEPALPVRQFRALWEDAEVKAALLDKFYVDPTPDFVDSIAIHEKEFEFVFCEADRFQNIHVDIPQKFLSFVFYFPEHDLSEEDQKRNATILYNRDLEPVHGARFKANSVCIFAPHFYSYHGFATTRERDVLVMFYTREADAKAWQDVTRKNRDQGPDFTATLDLIADKLRRHPLREYGAGAARIEAERAACKINAPKGRVFS